MTATRNPRASRHRGNLREACIEEALAIVDSAGIENLSLREVARRLGVSHQAPYRHFPSRDHLLAEIVSRAYTNFARYLEQRSRSEDAHADLQSMGIAYINYAFEHPLQYRLMFSIPLPDPKQHPDMLRNAQHAFSLLQTALAALYAQRRHPHTPQSVNYDALFIWSTLHGLVGHLQSHAVRTLNVPEAFIDQAVPETLARIDRCLFSTLPSDPA